MVHEAVIISDIHLGSDICRSKDLLDFLDTIDTSEVIINGDLFDSWDFRRLRKEHWKVLKRLRQLADKIKVVWISGNHDGPADIVGHLIGVVLISISGLPGMASIKSPLCGFTGWISLPNVCASGTTHWAMIKQQLRSS